MSQYQIISICQRTINIINCAQEGASLNSKQGTVKKKMHISRNIKAIQTKWIQSILKTIFEFTLTQVTCIGYIDFMLKGKSLLEYANVLLLTNIKRMTK